jgi:hypothetical protein
MTGAIISLYIVGKTYKEDLVALPIDALVIDLTKEDGQEEEAT